MTINCPVDGLVGEVRVDAALVRRALGPWADLPMRRFPADGTDNAIVLLGDAMALRLPRRAAP